MVECANLNKWGWEGMNGNNCDPIHPSASSNVRSGPSWTLTVQSIIFIASWTSSQDRFGVLFLFSSPINGTPYPSGSRGFFPSLPLFSHLFLSLSTPVPWVDRKHLLPYGSGGRYRPSEPVDAVPFSSLVFSFFCANKSLWTVVSWF